MGLLYVGTVLFAALAATFFLAFKSQEIQQAGLVRDLGKLAGFCAVRKIQAHGMGIAVDPSSRQFCLISTEGGVRRLRLLHFADVVMTEILRDGISALRAVRSGLSNERLPPPGNISGQHLALRLVARKEYAVDHVVAMPDMREAVRWHQWIKAGIHETSIVARPVLSKPATENQEGLRPDLQPSTQAQHKEGRPTTSDSAAKVVDQEDWEWLPPLLSQLLQTHLQEKPRLVISERALRDETGVDIPIIQFHKYLNQLKRKKAFPQLTLSYSRESETWKIARRQR